MDKGYARTIQKRIEKMNLEYGTYWRLITSDDSCCGPLYESARIVRPDGSVVFMVSQATDTLKIIEAFLNGVNYARTEFGYAYTLLI